MAVFDRVRSVVGAASIAALVSACSTTSSSPVAPIVPAGGGANSTSARATVSLADFDGAPVPYFRALREAGLLPPHTTARAWLNRAAFDESLSGREADSRMAIASNIHYVLYAASNGGTIDLYQSNTYEPQQPNPPIIGQIPDDGAVAGLAVDRSQNLYVNGNGGNILEYSRASMPVSTRHITDPYEPQGITVGPDGTLYGADFEADSTGNVGISVVPPGATSPTRTLDDPAIQHAYYDAVDIKGNVYLTYLSANGLSLGVFPYGSSKMTNIPVSDSPYQIELDANGDLLIANPGGATIDTIPNGSTTVSSSVNVAASQFFVFDQNYARNQVFTNVYGTNAQGGPLLQFTYPQGVQIDTIDRGTYEFGIVTSPAAPLPNPYVVPAPGASPPPPPAQPTQGPCQNGTTGPLPDPANDQITYGGGTSCVGPSANSEQISTTATLFDANNNLAVQSFSFGATGPNDAKKITTVCPGYGSYYVVVTSNVAPAVKSSTVTKAGC